MVNTPPPEDTIIQTGSRQGWIGRIHQAHVDDKSEDSSQKSDIVDDRELPFRNFL